MQARKKCEQCNTLNDSSQIYCVKCGKYLKGKSVRTDDKLTVWGMNEFVVHTDSNTLKGHNDNQVNTRQVVICPECSCESNVLNGVLPLSCSACGYFFQAGVDKIVNASDKPDQKTAPIPAGDPVEPVDTTMSSNPLKKAKKDISTLRLTAIASNHMLPETMKEAGNIIGKNGTAFRGFQSEQQISVWHTATGWYARVILGKALFNGVPMNQGIQIKLSTGDLLIVDQEQFMVEII